MNAAKGRQPVVTRNPPMTSIDITHDLEIT